MAGNMEKKKRSSEAWSGQSTMKAKESMDTTTYTYLVCRQVGDLGNT